MRAFLCVWNKFKHIRWKMKRWGNVHLKNGKFGYKTEEVRTTNIMRLPEIMEKDTIWEEKIISRDVMLGNFYI